MSHALSVYLQDHLAGARFAVSLLEELSAQDLDQETARIAGRLLPEILEDRALLEELTVSVGSDTSSLKETFAWFAQKVSQWKVSPHSRQGIFQAVEILSLGVLGKLALWNVLRVLKDRFPAVSSLDLDRLCDRATYQHAALENHRLKLALKAIDTGEDE